MQIVGDGGRVRTKGVVLESGEAVDADVVVCNADLPYAEKALLPESVSRSFEVSFFFKLYMYLAGRLCPGTPNLKGFESQHRINFIE